MFKWLFLSLFMISMICCTPKGPQTFTSPYIGKTKQELYQSMGKPTEIKKTEKAEIIIYRKREEYYGKKNPETSSKEVVPKKVFIIERIYYANSTGEIYKYQVWKKKG